MKVRELIKILQDFNPDFDVYVEGYEGGLDELGPGMCSEGFVERDANKSVITEMKFIGLHEERIGKKPYNSVILYRSS